MIETIKANKGLAISTLALWLLSLLELVWLKTAQAPSPADGKPSSSPSLGFSPEYRPGSNPVLDTEEKTPEELAGEIYGKLPQYVL